MQHPKDTTKKDTTKAGFEQRSYELHTAQYTEADEESKAAFDFYTQVWPKTVDAWRHERMFRLADALVQPGQQWMTVGDGNFGLDAKHIMEMGAEALPTDISTERLAYAQQTGFIPAYAKENAEALRFADGSFDYVMCKEAYHHLPRAPYGLYEMLRVARKGVVLIEPQDLLVQAPLLMGLANVLDRVHPRLLHRLWKNRYSFEEIGNFVYKLSKREVEKVASGLALPAVAFYPLNDRYVASWSEQPREGSSGLRKLKAFLGLANLLSWLGIVPHNKLIAVLFKEVPTAEEVKRLQQAGAYVRYLPKNPYLS